MVLSLNVMFTIEYGVCVIVFVVSLLLFLCLIIVFTFQLSPTTFEEVFKCLFDYLGRFFVMVRPRKLHYMSIGKW